MIKAFLSHSSADKDLVRRVAKQLGRNRIEYDEITFNENRNNEQEIRDAISRCSIFAWFGSASSIGSDWVRKELEIAREHELKDSTLFRIVAFIIDDTPYDHPGIPEWLKSEKNLSRKKMPFPIERLIRMHLAELIEDRQIHRDPPYLTRIRELSEFSDLVDGVSLKVPKCAFISGWPNVGRSTFAKQAVRSVDLIRHRHELPQIATEQDSSVEDIIYKIDDIGIADVRVPEDFFGIALDQKIEILSEQLNEIQSGGDILIIRDSHCLVSSERIIASWFISALQNISNEFSVLVITDRAPLMGERMKLDNSFIHVQVSPLDSKERHQLFNRILRSREIQLDKQTKEKFLSSFNGYPGQVSFAVDLIEDFGVDGARAKSEVIHSYSDFRAKQFLHEITDDDNVKSLLVVLSEVPYIETNFLVNEILESGTQTSIIERLIALGVVVFIGGEGEFIRISELARPIMRQVVPSVLTEKLLIRMRRLAKKALSEDGYDQGFYAYAAGMLAETDGAEIPRHRVAPTYIVSVIRRISSKPGRSKRVVELCKYLLDFGGLDERLELTTRYFLCGAYARLHLDDDFYKEIVHVSYLDKNTAQFLRAFKYRKEGKVEKAFESLQQIRGDVMYLQDRVPGETILLYLMAGEWEEAYSRAYQEFLRKPDNPFAIRQCVVAGIRCESIRADGEKLDLFLSSFSECVEERTYVFEQMSRAEVLGIVRGNFDEAIGIIRSLTEDDVEANVLELGCELSTRAKKEPDFRFFLRELSNEVRLGKSRRLRLEVMEAALNGGGVKLERLLTKAATFLTPAAYRELVAIIS
jgi:hypothetical protein